MCEAKIVTFDEGAVFLAASDVNIHDVTSFNVVRKLVLNLEGVPSVEGDYFGQITDNPENQPLLLRLLEDRKVPIVEQTPEELVEAGFSAEAIKRGLEAARPLAPITA